MTDTPNEQAPATRSEWLALIREAVRETLDEWLEGERAKQRPQPPSEG